MLTNKQITFVGAGSMAEAIIAGLLAKKIIQPTQITAMNRQDQEKLKRLSNTYQIHTTTNKEEALKNADIVVLAFKPKNITEGIDNIREYIHEKQLFISILAGITTPFIEEVLNFPAPVIRVMPNTSATVGLSATAISSGRYASDEHVKMAEQLFAAIGTVTIVPEEQQDAVTGVAGSGPAYIYYLVEAMERAARELGFDEQQGKTLVLETLKGAVKRLETSTKTPAELYKEVMSPGGSTEAAIKVLADYKFQEAMIAAIKRSAERAKEMGEEFSKK